MSAEERVFLLSDRVLALTHRVDELERLVAQLAPRVEDLRAATPAGFAEILADRAGVTMLELPYHPDPYYPPDPPFRHEPRPLPAVGQRVCVPVTFKRVGKCVGYEDGGNRVLVDLPGGKVESFDAGEVEAE